MATYAVFEGRRVLRMSTDRAELAEYIKSFPLEERRRMFLVEKENPDKEVDDDGHK